MMGLCLATVTNLALQGPLVTRLEDSVHAGSMSLVDSAQSVLQDTTASPTADVSEWFLPCVSRSLRSSLKHTGPNEIPFMCLLQPVSVAVACVTRWQESVSALLRQSDPLAMCVRVRLSAITPCWAVRAANALQVASETIQGPTVTASPDSAGKWTPAAFRESGVSLRD